MDMRENLYNLSDRKKLYKKAIQLWGKEFQIKMVIEECAELIVELVKFTRNTNGSNVDKVCDELADVEIMIEQMRIIFTDDLIDFHKDKKIGRLKRRIKDALHTRNRK